MKGVQLTINETLNRSSLQSRLDGMTLGLFHMISVGICGMSLFFRGAITEALKRSSLAYPVDYFASICSTLSLIIGLGLSCWLSSITGRRLLVIIGLVLIGLCSYLASISVAVEAIYGNFALTLIGCGLSLPASIATTIETFPSKLAGLGIGILVSFYVAGQFYVSASTFFFDPKDFCAPSSDSALCGFQLRLELIAVPLIVAAITASLFLHESPFAMQDDCYTLNSLMSVMSRNKSTQFKFSPSSMGSPTIHRKALSRTEIVLGVLWGASLTYMSSWGCRDQFSLFSLSAVLVIVLALSTVPVSNPRIAAMAVPFLLMILMSLELVTGASLGFEVGSRSLAIAGWIYAILSLETWADRFSLIAVIVGVGEVLATCWPLFVNIHLETEETAFSIIFGLTGVVAVFLLSSQPTEMGQEELGPKFKKIPIVQYGSS